MNKSIVTRGVGFWSGTLSIKKDGLVIQVKQVSRKLDDNIDLVHAERF